MANLPADSKIESSQPGNGYLGLPPTRMTEIQSIQACLMGEMRAFNSDVTKFVHKRLRHDVDTSSELMGCKTSMEVANLMARFYERAFFDYSAQATQMFEMTRSLMRSLSEASVSEKAKATGSERDMSPATGNETELSNACELPIVIMDPSDTDQRPSPAA